MLESTKDDLMVGAASFALSAAVAAGAALTWFIIGLGCGLGESGTAPAAPCTGLWLIAPQLGMLVAVGAWIAMALTRSARIYWWGTGLAAVLGGGLWLFAL